MVEGEIAMEGVMVRVGPGTAGRSQSHIGQALRFSGNLCARCAKECGIHVCGVDAVSCRRSPCFGACASAKMIVYFAFTMHLK